MRPACPIGRHGSDDAEQRRSYEAGHKPKYLVVIDDTPECDRAIYYAARRAARIKSQIVMLRVIETEDRNQQWLGVADIMKAEAHEEANAVLDRSPARVNEDRRHRAGPRHPRGRYLGRNRSS